MVLGAVLVSVSCQEGRHGQCRCNALTCGCDCHTNRNGWWGQPPGPDGAVTESAPAAATPDLPRTVELPPNFERFRPSNREPCRFGCGGEYLPGAGMSVHERACVMNPDPRAKAPKSSRKLDSAVRAHQAALEKLRAGTGPARSARQMSTKERRAALDFIDAREATMTARRALTEPEPETTDVDAGEPAVTVGEILAAMAELLRQFDALIVELGAASERLTRARRPH